MESNHHELIQNQLSYRLDDPGIEFIAHSLSRYHIILDMNSCPDENERSGGV